MQGLRKYLKDPRHILERREVIELQNPILLRTGIDLKGHQVLTPSAMGRNTFHKTRLFRALFNLALNTTRYSTAFLSNLFQSPTTLTMQNLFLIFNIISNIILSSFNFYSLPLVLSIQFLMESSSLGSLQMLQTYFAHLRISPFILLVLPGCFSQSNENKVYHLPSHSEERQDNREMTVYYCWVSLAAVWQEREKRCECVKKCDQ